MSLLPFFSGGLGSSASILSNDPENGFKGYISSAIGVARIGDMGIGVCPCHTTPMSYTTIFATGASSVNVNGRTIANFTTIGISSCGHPTVVTTVSGKVNAEKTGVHRITDTGMNCGSYTTVSSSNNVKSE